MEKTYLLSADFWQSDKSLALSHNRFDRKDEITAKFYEMLRGHLFFQTSGSSGTPKWVAIGKRALLASAAAVLEHLSIRKGEGWFAALPRFHVAGMGMFARAYLNGAEVVEYGGSWDAKSFGIQLSESGCRWVSLVPAQVVDLVDNKVFSPELLRGVVVGGGSLAKKVEKKAIQLGWPILPSYGMTEAGSQLGTATSVGGPILKLPHIEWKLDAGGRLIWKGTSMFSGYVKGDQFIEAKEWMKTNDEVKLEGPRLIFVRRRDKFVKVLGELVDVGALEYELNQRADQLVVIVAIPDRRRGNRLIPVVESPPSEELIKLLQSFVGLQRFGQIEVTAVPRSALGKPLIKNLRSKIMDLRKGRE